MSILMANDNNSQFYQDWEAQILKRKCYAQSLLIFYFPKTEFLLRPQEQSENLGTSVKFLTEEHIQVSIIPK